MTVCKRVRDSHIYVTAGTEFPGNLLEEASGRIPVAIATFSPIFHSSLQASRILGGKTETVSHHPAQAMMQVFIQCSISCRKQRLHWEMQKREEETASTTKTNKSKLTGRAEAEHQNQDVPMIRLRTEKVVQV